jgi:flavin reductase (DIM6/NTAB) family NADH-FMN oxidoreductase RutF
VTLVSANDDVAAVMDSMPYGLYILGSHSPDGEANGMMADWVMQVSFNPRRLAVSFENDAHSLANVRATKFFTINLLGQDHEGMELAQQFAQPYFDSKIRGRTPSPSEKVHHKLDDLPFSTTANGAPILRDAIAWAECEAEQFVSVGDHTLVVGNVLDGRVVRDAEALTSSYTGWPYSG